MEGDEEGAASADPGMTTVSWHSFGDDSGNPDFCISVIENMKEEYGLFVWPCSVILAEYVWQQRLRFSDATVVELGAGTSLPGLVAAKLGCNVTLTDDSNRLEVLENMRRVCELNKLKCTIMGLTWGVWDASVFSLKLNIILGADVLYDASAFDDLFATVAFLLQNIPGTVFITTYHNRSGHHLIGFLMVKWGLKCVKLIDGFSFMPSHKASGLNGNIQLAEIVLCGDFLWPAKPILWYAKVLRLRLVFILNVIASSRTLFAEFCFLMERKGLFPLRGNILFVFCYCYLNFLWLAVLGAMFFLE